MRRRLSFHTALLFGVILVVGNVAAVFIRLHAFAEQTDRLPAILLGALVHLVTLAGALMVALRKASPR